MMLKQITFGLGSWSLAVTSALAQEAGQIVGSVHDQSGAVVPNAPVTATEAGTNFAEHQNRRQWGVRDALVVSLGMKMDGELGQCAAERTFAEQDQLPQTFLFHRSHPPFGVGVGRRRQLHLMATMPILWLKSSTHTIP